MMDNRGLNHFQKSFQSMLMLFLRESAFVNSDDAEARAEKLLDRISYAYENTDILQQREEKLCDELAQVLNISEEQEKLLELVREANKLTQKDILEAPVRVYNDFGEAGEAVRAFLSDANSRECRFRVDTGHAKAAFYYFKLQYSENIDFLYGTEFKDIYFPLTSTKAMDYLGFCSRLTGIGYALKHPADMCWIHRKDQPYPESEGELKKSMIQAIKEEVERRVANQAMLSDSAEIMPVDLPKEVDTAAISFSKGKTILPFTDRIVTDDYIVYGDHIVRFIDNRDMAVSERADHYMKGRESELRRLWEACRVGQRILDQMNAGGNTANIGDFV